jgi:hypothetical protein
MSSADPSNASVLQINMCKADSVALHDPSLAKRKSELFYLLASDRRAHVDLRPMLA